jgi:heme/copper-type cytochrome/quinol oxidase subunit 1
MHALGLSGMPRRIPDYPDGYADWNSIMTYGSILTVFSVLIFLHLISHLFKLFKANRNWISL